MAHDCAELMAHLGHNKYHVIGEDWGVAWTYQLAAQFPQRVSMLIFQEMLLPGSNLGAWSHLMNENVKPNRWL